MVLEFCYRCGNTVCSCNKKEDMKKALEKEAERHKFRDVIFEALLLRLERLEEKVKKLENRED